MQNDGIGAVSRASTRGNVVFFLESPSYYFEKLQSATFRETIFRNLQIATSKFPQTDPDRTIGAPRSTRALLLHLLASLVLHATSAG